MEGPERITLEVPEILLAALVKTPPKPTTLERVSPIAQLAISAITPLVAVVLFFRFGSDERSLAIKEAAQKTELGAIQLAATQGRLVVSAPILASRYESEELVPPPGAAVGSSAPQATANAPPPSPTYLITYSAKFTNPNQQPIYVTSHKISLYTGTMPKRAPNTFMVMNQPETPGPVNWRLGTEQTYSDSYGNTGLHELNQTTLHRYVFFAPVADGDLIAIRSTIRVARHSDASATQADTEQEVIAYCNPSWTSHSGNDNDQAFACAESNFQPQISQSPDELKPKKRP